MTKSTRCFPVTYEKYLLTFYVVPHMQNVDEKQQMMRTYSSALGHKIGRGTVESKIYKMFNCYVCTHCCVVHVST